MQYGEKFIVFLLLGHLGKYGSYTLMHPDSNTILDMQLVQVNLFDIINLLDCYIGKYSVVGLCIFNLIYTQSDEVGGSFHMEKEGLKRCLDHLEANRLTVEYITTDRHPQIQKFLRERNIVQFYDVWHFEKGDY